MTPPHLRSLSLNPSFSRNLVVVSSDKPPAVFDPKQTGEGAKPEAVMEAKEMFLIYIGPEGRPASSPEQDLKMTLQIISDPSSAVFREPPQLISSVQD